MVILHVNKKLQKAVLNLWDSITEHSSYYGNKVNSPLPETKGSSENCTLPVKCYNDQKAVKKLF